MKAEQYRELMTHISVPDGLNDRVLSAARREASASQRQPRRPLLRAAVCTVCALALVLGTVRFVPQPKEADDLRQTMWSGIDIPAEAGSKVLAAADGTVTETGFDVERGNYLIIDHGDGLTTLYAACQNVEAAKGDTVQAGEPIAAVGSTGRSTGAHLHLEVRQDGQAQDPVAYFSADVRETLRMG